MKNKLKVLDSPAALAPLLDQMDYQQFFSLLFQHYASQIHHILTLVQKFLILRNNTDPKSTRQFHLA